MPSECAVTARHHKHVAEFFGELGVVDRSLLEDSLPNQAEHLGRFLGEAGAGVEQSVSRR